jgi:hypothetical protein
MVLVSNDISRHISTIGKDYVYGICGLKQHSSRPGSATKSAFAHSTKQQFIPK